MSAIGDARADLAIRLQAAGVPNVSTDPRLQVPGVLVDVPTDLIPMGANAGWTATIPVKVIHPPPGDPPALDWLLATVEEVLITLGPATARAELVTLNDKEHPAYVITQTVPVPNPAC